LILQKAVGPRKTQKITKIFKEIQNWADYLTRPKRFFVDGKHV